MSTPSNRYLDRTAALLESSPLLTLLPHLLRTSTTPPVLLGTEQDHIVSSLHTLAIQNRYLLHLAPMESLISTDGRVSEQDPHYALLPLLLWSVLTCERAGIEMDDLVSITTRAAVLKSTSTDQDIYATCTRALLIRKLVAAPPRHLALAENIITACEGFSTRGHTFQAIPPLVPFHWTAGLCAREDCAPPAYALPWLLSPHIVFAQGYSPTTALSTQLLGVYLARLWEWLFRKSENVGGRSHCIIRPDFRPAPHSTHNTLTGPIDSPRSRSSGKSRIHKQGKTRSRRSEQATDGPADGEVRTGCHEPYVVSLDGDQTAVRLQFSTALPRELRSLIPRTWACGNTAFTFNAELGNVTLDDLEDRLESIGQTAFPIPADLLPNSELPDCFTGIAWLPLSKQARSIPLGIEIHGGQPCLRLEDPALLVDSTIVDYTLDIQAHIIILEIPSGYGVTS